MHLHEDSVSFVLGEIKSALETQRRQAESLETKASVLIGFAGAILALLINARQAIEVLEGIGKILLLAGVASFGLSLAFLFNWAYGVRKWYSVPAPPELIKYLSVPSEELRREIIQQGQEVWEENAKIIKRRARYLRVAFALQGLGVLFVAATLFFAILQR